MLRRHSDFISCGLTTIWRLCFGGDASRLEVDLMSELENVAVKRVLIYRLGSLGDTLVALPALRLVARAFPNAERRIDDELSGECEGPGCGCDPGG